METLIGILVRFIGWIIFEIIIECICKLVIKVFKGIYQVFIKFSSSKNKL